MLTVYNITILKLLFFYFNVTNLFIAMWELSDPQKAVFIRNKICWLKAGNMQELFRYMMYIVSIPTPSTCTVNKFDFYF